MSAKAVDTTVVKLGADVVQLYFRKSQIDFLLKSVLGHIWESQKQKVTFPEDFLISLRECFSQIPSETVADVWIIFNKELLEHYNGDEIAHEKFELVGTLMFLFLESIAVDQVPERTAVSLSAQLKETIDFTVNRLSCKCLQQKSLDDSTFVFCLLLLGCSHFFEALPEDSAFFRAMPVISVADLECAEEFYDMSPLFPQLSAKKWKKIHRLIVKRNDPRLNIVWEHLLLRSLRLCHMIDLGDKPFTRKTKLCDYLILEKVEGLDLSNDSPWNGQLSSVNKENYGIALWSLLCDNLSVLLPKTSKGLSTSYHATISRVLVSVLLQMPEDTSKVSGLRLASLRFLSDFCHSNGVVKLQSMQSDIFAAWINSLSKIFNSSEEKRSKRMKGTAVGDAVRRVMLLLEDAPSSDDILSDDGKVLWPSQELFALVDELLLLSQSESERNLDDKKAFEVMKHLKIMCDFLVRCLGRVDSVRCLLAAMSLLTFKSDRVPLFEVGLKVISGILDEGQGLQLILLGVDASHLLSFLWSLSDSAENQLNRLDLMKEMTRILKVALRAVFRRTQSIQQLDEFISENMSCVDELRKKQGSSALMVKHVLRLVNCMESTHKVLHTYVRPDIKPLLISTRTNLVKHFWKLLKKLCHKTAKASDESMDFSENPDSSGENFVGVYLLSGYTCLLEGIRQDSEENDTCIDAEELLGVLPALCQICLTFLRQSKKHDVLVRCLDFVSAVCSHLKIASGVLPGDVLNNIWTVIVDCLRQHIRSSLSPKNEPVHNTSQLKLQTALQKTIAAVTNSFELSEFDRHLQLLQNDVKSCSLGEDPAVAIAAFRIFQQLAVQSMNEECQNSFYLSCQKLLVLVQDILSQCRSVHVVAAVLENGTALISLGQGFLESNELSLCLSLFAEIDLESVDDLDDFVNLFCKSYFVLNALFLHHGAFVHNAVPAIVVVIKKLLRAIMMRSRQDPRKHLDHTHINKLDDCARLIYRLTGMVCEQKIDFAKIAPFFIYEYVSEVQKGTIYPIVKTTLLMAIYKWLDICNDHATAHLHRVLPDGAKEIFRFIHEEFERNYRYKGKS